MKTGILYIRVSTDEQADKGYSQRNQQEVLQKFCDANSIQITKIYLEDHSAKTFNRPEWIRLLSDLKKARGNTDLLLFTKWDRFSRNAGDAYQMLNKLEILGVEPQAIEQPLDLSIPENKMMLAIYLAAPEVENDRRALNVLFGMRRAKKEGRWMGRAPTGYCNRSTETGTKYITLEEPQATLMKWCFEEIAKGILSTEQVWKEVKKKGLHVARNNFWRSIRNPAYCGKIFIPKYKNEDSMLVPALHQPLISETLFYAAQDALDGRKRSARTTIDSNENLPLRGFLECPNCKETLTGSGSKGRSEIYYYYHCNSKCGFRIRVEDLHKMFVGELKKYMPDPAVNELFKEVIHDVNNNQTKYLSQDRKQLLLQIGEQSAQMSKLRELLLNGTIEPSDYKLMKADIEDKMNKLELRLSTASATVKNIENTLNEAAMALSQLDMLYLLATTKQKREIIGSIFSEKLVFEKTKVRTAKVNEVIDLMYLIKKNLRHKKREKNDIKSTFSLEVHL